MDANLAMIGQKKRATKKGKAKKTNAIKVVYISNPMKIKTSASKFRALVQELTGQDAEYPDPSKFHHLAVDHDHEYVGMNGISHDHQMSHEDDDEGFASTDHVVGLDGGHDRHLHEHPAESESYSTSTTTCNYFDNYEPLDDVFTPQMMDSLSGLLPSSLLYEPASHQIDHGFTRAQLDIDAV